MLGYLKWVHIDCFVQDCSISIADALEILKFCTKPLIFNFWSCQLFVSLFNHLWHHMYKRVHFIELTHSWFDLWQSAFQTWLYHSWYCGRLHLDWLNHSRFIGWMIRGIVKDSYHWLDHRWYGLRSVLWLVESLLVLSLVELCMVLSGNVPSSL